MSKDLFDWIGECKARWGKKKTRPADDGYTGRADGGGSLPVQPHDLYGILLKRLDDEFRGRMDDGSQKILQLYINDNLLFHRFDDAAIRGIRQYLSENRGYEFAAVEVREGRPDEAAGAVEVAKKVWLLMHAVQEEVPSVTRCGAVLTAVEGCGSLVGGQTVLEAGTLRYNIGLGEHPRTQGGQVRYNQVAIDDRPERPEYGAFNKYVSRTHAHIVYDERYGFVLYAEPNGTRERGKRTMVIRKNGTERVELDNPMIGVPLRDGDSIVLSGKVQLMFHEQ